MMIKRRWMCLLLVGAASILLHTGCGKEKNEAVDLERKQEEKVQIGLSWDTFVLERWIRDRDVFLSTATELGAEVNVQNANGDLEKQVSQIEYLVEKGMDVIVIVAIDTDSAELKKAVGKAQETGIKIIAYDRLLLDANVDLFISFDNKKVGELMAQAAIDSIRPDGKIASILGSPTDSNVMYMEEGIREVLEENQQQLVYITYAEGWKAEYGYQYAKECILEYGEVDVLICGNDGIASTAFQFLAERKMAGKIKLIGQDADIEACQRIVEGQQYMTVYKDLQTLAKQAAQYAVALGKGKEINPQNSIWDGTYEVPAYCLEPVAITKENLDEEIIESQFHFRDEVYLHADEEK